MAESPGLLRRSVVPHEEADNAFNTQDFAAINAAHHPDMIAHVRANDEPIRGRDAHAAAMLGRFRAFPDSTSTTLPARSNFADALGDVVTRETGTFSGELVLPDGTVIPGRESRGGPPATPRTDRPAGPRGGTGSDPSSAGCRLCRACAAVESSVSTLAVDAASSPTLAW